MLFPYLSTASGLSQWFADDVTVDEDHIFTFKWNDEVYKAKIAAHRTNSYVKFEFLDKNNNDEEDPWSIEMRIEENELTQSVYIKVIEYSDMDDLDEQREIWEHLFYNLKETVGG